MLRELAIAVAVSGLVASCAHRHTDTIVEPLPMAGDETPALRSGGDSADREWRNPTAFSTRVRVEAEAIQTGIARDVGEGRLPASAEDEMRRRHAFIEQMLQRYGTDGVIRYDEKRHVDILLERMREARDAYERAARGGGP